MGYGYYLMDGYVPRIGRVMMRPSGYYVLALCDVPGCQVLIDRGLAWRCGELHSTDGQHGEHGHGCGAYVCGRHEHAHDCPNEYDYEIVTGAAPQEGQ